MTKEYIIDKIKSMNYENITHEPMTFGPNIIISFHTLNGLSVCSVSFKKKSAAIINIELLPLQLVENSQINAFAETLLEATNFVNSINSENKN